MEVKNYPGKGLSLQQLVFALNEELKRNECSPPFTLDTVSQLERDTLAALAIIRDWINSFVPINRLPMDVLFLIPTHLPSEGDRFRATFVCRRWRRTLLQHAGLWSHLDLSKGEVYVKTLLERTRGAPLSILAGGTDPVGAISLLPFHTKRIKSIEFTNSTEASIQRFSEINSGPFPLLRTLDIYNVSGIGPNSPLFSGAVGLKELRLHSGTPSLLSHFVFPNLTFFELSVMSIDWLQLLDFLEASPMLRTVVMKIVSPMSVRAVPRERVVVLHNVEDFSLVARYGALGYKLATHISCPSAKRTSLFHMRRKRDYLAIPQEVFPASDLLKTIIRQYGKSPIEEVTFETASNSDRFIACSLSFRSADATTIGLCFQVVDDSVMCSILERSLAEMCRDAVLEASRAIRDLTLLANVKRLHIRGSPGFKREWMKSISTEVGKLFKSLGPLEELTISRSDMQPYIYPFPGLKGLVVYPPIEVLTISDPSNMLNEDVAAGLVKLARVQHELGVPFGRVTVHMQDPPADMEERLRPWVGPADCCSTMS